MGKICAVVTINRESVGGGAPIFVENSADHAEKTAFLLEKILDASTHDLKNGTFILVSHAAK
ncbi:hypothetical protein BG53_01550 [Paenibacillus darwinianus]|uniref:Uncharacterized protein n=1 Tax=Paenibacillus darwinianus TaxID=1380763 RepID=A0A9W5W8J0_9BACL|nr:hypothetical protein [Paenibacillus darwinianus]EXX91397.1 hypothetical protein BG52_10555 [Paenibacillus darwinianus]EXX92229.1 hypothetical protein BG53_01550 [Paenibacillus darwinianus]EXX92330.1 hypothetical protein CH50_11560 [Paenibacillus darwinianus]